MPIKIHVPSVEYYDSSNEIFITIDSIDLELEHSLFSISKWESIWKKPFLSETEKTKTELLSYIECMVLNENFDKRVLLSLTSENMEEIVSYIDEPHTATTFNDKKNHPPSRDIITAEIVYYWMFSNGVPLECEHWNFDKLMSVLHVCAIKNTTPTKMSKKDILSQKYALNNHRLGLK